MKNEQVVPNYKIMLETSFTLLALVASGWLLIKLISACFWLPGLLKKWHLEETKQVLDQHRRGAIDERESRESDSTSLKDSSGETTDSEKSKDDFEKIAEVAEGEHEEIADDATKKNK